MERSCVQGKYAQCKTYPCMEALKVDRGELVVEAHTGDSTI